MSVHQIPSHFSTRRVDVVVTHPVHQHAYETAAAAQDAGLLREFVTAFYARSDTAAGLRASRLLPRGFRETLRRYLSRRHHPDLDGRLVTTMSWRQLAAVAGRHPALARVADGVLGSGWFERGFDRAVARRLRLDRATPPAIVHAFEGAALETLKAARSRGSKTVLDVPSAHEQLRAVTAAEGARVDHFDTRRVQEERRWADYLFAPSVIVERCLLEHGASPETIVVIPLGVDPTRFSPATDRVRGGLFRFLYAGAIAPQKGIRYLLDAWRAMDLRDAELVLVGPLGRGGEELLRDMPVGCRWVGAVGKSEVDRWFKAADALVLPSLSDSWGLVVAEGLACGLPVVTTEACGFPVEDGIQGYVVPPRDAAVLGAAMRSLHDAPDHAAAMGVAGRELILANYTWAHYRRRIQAAYEAIFVGSNVTVAVASVDAAELRSCG